MGYFWILRLVVITIITRGSSCARTPDAFVQCSLSPMAFVGDRSQKNSFHGLGLPKNHDPHASLLKRPMEGIFSDPAN